MKSSIVFMYSFIAPLRFCGQNKIIVPILIRVPSSTLHSGAQQEEDPEGDGARHADPPRRVHPGAGAAAAQDPAEAAHGPDPTAAPDRAGEPDRVQQPAGTRAPPQACAGAPAAAQEPQGEWAPAPVQLQPEHRASSRVWSERPWIQMLGRWHCLGNLTAMFAWIIGNFYMELQ